MKSNSKTQKLTVLWDERSWSASIDERPAKTDLPADRVAIYSTDHSIPKSDTQLIVRNRLVDSKHPYRLRGAWNN